MSMIVLTRFCVILPSPGELITVKKGVHLDAVDATRQDSDEVGAVSADVSHTP